MRADGALCVMKGEGCVSALVWLGVSLPVMAAMLYLFFTVREKKLRLIAKGGATWVALMTAAVGTSMGGGLPAGGILTGAAALFVLADVLLEVKFLPGVAAFGLGHIALIGWIFAQGLEVSLWCIPVSAALYAASVFLFRKPIRGAGTMGKAMLVYAAVLSLMTGISVLLPWTGGPGYAPFAAGALCFLISDLMVAQGVLTGIGRKAGMSAMVLYETAVMLMALSCW